MQTTQTTVETVLSSDTKIEHVSMTIKAGQVFEKFTPLVVDAASGHYIAAPSSATSAQFLSSFAVDATDGATPHRAIKAIAINADVVAWPDGMAEPAKAALFAGTPISIEKLA